MVGALVVIALGVVYAVEIRRDLAASVFEFLSKRVENPFRVNSGSVRRRHLVDLATL